MMISNAKSKINNDDLICPITFEIFRNPVIAGDGHTYERAAIVRWILEHGTSPLTRQPLNINELQADDYLRNLIVQWRNSSTYSNYNINVDQPILQRQNSEMSYNYYINVNQPVIIEQQIIHNNNVVLTSNARNSCDNNIRRYGCCFCSFFTTCFILVTIILYYHSTDEVSSSGRMNLGYSGEFSIAK